MSIKNRCFDVFRRSIFSGTIVSISVFLLPTGHADDSLWKLLERDGEVLDLMAVESVGDHILLLGAKYEQQQWQTSEEIGKPESEAGIRKQLHVLNINKRESVVWQRSYPALPDVAEIFSTGTTEKDRVCVAYARHYGSDEFLNPVVLQIEANGKIIWANIEAISKTDLQSSSKERLQIANLDSISVVGTAENGCALGYILRRQTASSETFQANLLVFDERGNHQWNFTHKTNLYGKMFLTRDSDAEHFVILQTNQSRDAAIEAMMAGRPFSPHTNMLIVSYTGKLSKIHEEIQPLSKVWVKHLIDAPGDRVLLAGNSKTAWTAFLDSEGNLSGMQNSMAGEFSYVNHRQQNGYILVRGESLVSMEDRLIPRMDKPISQIVKNKYSNAYLERKLPDEVPVQNIVPLNNSSYLMLYKLGSKLLKIELQE